MITSTSNTRVKNIISLKKSVKERKKQESFLVEGPRMFFELPPSLIREVYLTEDFRERYADRLPPVPYEIISDQVCSHLSDTKTPQGVIAVARQPRYDLDEILEGQDDDPGPCFIILEDVQDPGNAGTILRTAEAAGVSAVIMNRDTVDPFNPKVIRATMGAVFRIPFLVTKDLEGTIRRLKAAGITIYAAHLGGEVFYEADYRGPCGFLIGNEGKGLTEQTAALSHARIRIPMKGKVESLNASVAASLIMYEVMRQRETAGRHIYHGSDPA